MTGQRAAPPAAPKGPGAPAYALLSIATALVTIALKLLDWKLTGSVGLLSDAIESFVNLLAALVAFWALTVAKRTKQALGKDVYRGGNINAGVPACMGCHGPTGRGNAPAKYPSVGGQDVTYIVAQLNAFRDGSRSNDRNGMMRSVVARMSAAEIEAVANYIATLK